MKRRQGRPRGRGGRRAGAGRKPTAGIGTQVVAVTLTPKHIEKVERWQEASDAESFSEAVRQMLDAAPPP